MGKTVNKDLLGKEIPVAVSENAAYTPVTDYLPLPEIVREVEADFNKKMEIFYSCTLEDDRIEKAAKAWQKAGALLMGYAESLFKIYPDDQHIREYALELIDKASKAANLRLGSLKKHCDIKAEANPNDETVEAQIEKIKYEAYVDVLRSANTWRRFRDAYVKGESFANAERQEEIEAAIAFEEEKVLYPTDHVFIPGRIYPAIPIPPGEPVPQPPLAYQLEKEAPVEAKEYDPELDELVIKKGWVDPNGMIDDQSVIRDRKNGVVIMRLIGQEEPEVWKEWKATWTGDVMEDGSWEEEYYFRLGEQMMQHPELQLFQRQRYEDYIRRKRE